MQVKCKSAYELKDQLLCPPFESKREIGEKSNSVAPKEMISGNGLVQKYLAL